MSVQDVVIQAPFVKARIVHMIQRVMNDSFNQEKNYAYPSFKLSMPFSIRRCCRTELILILASIRLAKRIKPAVERNTPTSELVEIVQTASGLPTWLHVSTEAGRPTLLMPC
jgi:hypothetical protein